MSYGLSEFRSVMARFATGVTVVTTVERGAFYGLTVNAFCSISLEPNLLLVSLSHRSQTYAVIRRSGVFAVNILTAEQRDVALRFAQKGMTGGKSFNDIPLQTRVTGAPLFTDALAQIECRVVAEYPGGDHALILGEAVSLDVPRHAEADESSPLLYYRSSFLTLPAEARTVDLVGGDAIPARTAVGAEAGSAPVMRRLLRGLRR